MPPLTTKRRTKKNLKTKNNQNCQKIELYGSLTTMELKEETFIQTSRRGRDGKWGWRGLVARQWLEDQAVPYLHADKLGGTSGEQDRWCNPGFQCREIKPQNL